MSEQPRRRGPRPGDVDTRGAILLAAREAFASKGFARTSLRGVARDADVDDALVRHYFGDKLGLLMATLQLHIDPALLVQRVAAAGRPGLGRRIVATVLTVYESPIGRAAQQAIAAHPEVGRSIVEALVTQLGRQADLLLADVPAAQRRERVAVVQDVLTGLGMSRLILGVGPLAELSKERCVEIFGPILQDALDGRLTGPRRG